SSGAPRWVDIGPAAQINDALNNWRKALRDPARTNVNRLARVLGKRLMQPVLASIGSAQHLLISPDGPLNLVPFAALVDERDNYLVERYNISYLTSGRDLLRLQIPRDNKNASVVVADPAFGQPALAASRGSLATSRVSNSAGPARLDYSQIFFGPLPGVTAEVRALRTILPKATFLTGEQATKSAVRSLSGPTTLHIATHGFFLQEVGDNSEKPGMRTEATRIGRWVARVDNPLLRSGLALAGANNAGEDGVLTALEAAGLDLWGTRLVVLSACDTGIGEVKNGDGVYGLRRALVLAGAESQVMSLWPVSDRSTAQLMTGYYKSLTAGKGRGEALRQVQLQMLRETTHRHPYYWASFIQSGEWANLQGIR
ncbi:MAG TPA: CHAT domain-containing protein, partial [Blastocatellia bacterium]|nr:CHAT domain-containing protein [Blastocatellia bacterium]